MYRILSVDDEPINQIIVEELFSDRYEVYLADSGEECLKTVENIKPQLILLDVSMSGMDGYTTSLLLKENDKTKNIPVIFVSARSTLEDKLKGYAAGGHDYITKPFDHHELTIKINQLIENPAAPTVKIPQPLRNNGKIQLDEEDSAVKLTLIEEFIHASLKGISPEELANSLLDICNKMRLNCTLQLRIGGKTLNISSSGQHTTPLEASLFRDALARERFFDCGVHMIISYPHVSLIIKNMPVKETEHTEEIKRLLGILVAELESRIAR